MNIDAEIAPLAATEPYQARLVSATCVSVATKANSTAMPPRLPPKAQRFPRARMAPLPLDVQAAESALFHVNR